MQAKDVMVSNVVTVTPDTAVSDIAKVLLERRISAVPVVDPDHRILGIVSEGDLLRRPETGTDRRRPRWLSFLGERAELAAEYVKTHGLRAADIMTRPAITVSEETPLSEVAELLERRRIKRVAVVRGDKLVGIVTRSDLLRGLVAYGEELKTAPSPDDRSIREKLTEILNAEGWVSPYVNVTVIDGVVHLWGLVASDQERRALRVAAEGIPGVRAVEDHLTEASVAWGD